MRGDESRWNDFLAWRIFDVLKVIVETVYCIQNAKSWKIFLYFSRFFFLNSVAPSCEKKSRVSLRRRTR